LKNKKNQSINSKKHYNGYITSQATEKLTQFLFANGPHNKRKY